MYATALTRRCLQADMSVVDPSRVIANRVEGSLDTAIPDVTVSDTPERLGLQVTGESSAVRRLGETLEDISLDTLAWPASLPRSSVYVGRVDRTNDHGAIVETGAGEGFLPFSEADSYVDDGDRLIVQLRDPQPPWAPSRRPVLSTTLQVPGTFVSLIAGEDGIVEAPDNVIARALDGRSEDVPRGWGMAIHASTSTVTPTQVERELETLSERAREIDAARSEADRDGDLGEIIKPESTRWVRLGREARFAMDTDRRQVTPTIEGHHRIKSIGNGAGQAVDFVEALDLGEVSFDPAAVLGAFGPAADDSVRLEHGKPTGETIVLGRGTVTDVDGEKGSITVERSLSGGGTYDALGVSKEEGDVAETTFVEGRWWYPTVYRSAEDAYKGTYVNVGTPVELYPRCVRYVDLYVDVIKDPDGEIRIVDEDELQAAVREGWVDKPLADRARSVADAITNAF